MTEVTISVSITSTSLIHPQSSFLLAFTNTHHLEFKLTTPHQKPKTRTSFRSLFKSSTRSKTLPPLYTPNENPSTSRPTSSTSHIPHQTPTSPPQDIETPLPQIPEDFGFFPLHPPLPELRVGQSYPVDIIALHGVNGHHKKTWTHFDTTGAEQDVFWLRDFLPRVFPGARIYTYGYDARLLFSRATGNINSFAGTLLEEIMDVRTRREVSVSFQRGGGELMGV